MEHSWQQWCHNAHCVNEKGNQLKVDYLFKIAPAGFEPARSGTRSHRLTAWPRGNYSIYFTENVCLLQAVFFESITTLFKHSVAIQKVKVSCPCLENTKVVYDSKLAFQLE